MAAAPKQMHLAAYYNPTGHHVASWRHPRAQADAQAEGDEHRDPEQRGDDHEERLDADRDAEQAEVGLHAVAA